MSATAAPWRNGIVGTGEESPADLVVNPANWRTHPQSQQDALAGVLDEVGWVSQVLVNRVTGRLVDDSGPDGRRALATALFAKTEVLGYERMFYELMPDAIDLGLNAALPATFEIGQEREFGRGERI